MKKKILIFSAGSSGREIFQLISNINKSKNEWDIIGYVDDDPKKTGNKIDDVMVYSNKNKPKKKIFLQPVELWTMLIGKEFLKMR